MWSFSLCGQVYRFLQVLFPHLGTLYFPQDPGWAGIRKTPLCKWAFTNLKWLKLESPGTARSAAGRFITQWSWMVKTLISKQSANAACTHCINIIKWCCNHQIISEIDQFELTVLNYKLLCLAPPNFKSVNTNSALTICCKFAIRN